MRFLECSPLSGSSTLLGESRIRSIRFDVILTWPENRAVEEESRRYMECRFEKHFGRKVSMIVSGDEVELRKYAWFEVLMQELEG